MALDLKNLKVITKSSSTSVDTKVNEVTNQKDVKLNKLEESYTKVRKGDMGERDFYKTLMRTQPKLLSKISDSSRIGLNKVLKDLLSWYLDIKKIMISYDPTDSSPRYNEFKRIEKDLNSFLLSERFDKLQSFIVRDLVKEFLNDDLLDQKYNISNKFVNYLVQSGRTTSFIKEITLCFGMYKKYIGTLANDFSNQVNSDQDKVYFKKMDEVQPRFNMINNHIKKSIPSGGNKRDFDLKVIGDLNSYDQTITKDMEISGMGLKKRLVEINQWLNNGFIHAQYSYNRLNNLKIVRNEKNVSKNYEPHITDNYRIWALLKDIEAFLGSMEDLLSGRSFIIGIITEDNLDVLNVNY